MISEKQYTLLRNENIENVLNKTNVNTINLVRLMENQILLGSIIKI